MIPPAIRTQSISSSTDQFRRGLASQAHVGHIMNDKSLPWLVDDVLGAYF
jgi:hypothetical protein